jgi:hypothetical protein
MAEVWIERCDCEDDSLPDVCLFCDRDGTWRVWASFGWFPRLAYLALLVHPVVFGVLAAAFRRTIDLHVPVCDAHRAFRWRRLFVFLTSLVLISAAVVAGSCALDAVGKFDPTFAGLLWLFGINAVPVLWIASMALLDRRGVRAAEITRRGARLTGVSRAFVAAYQEQLARRPAVPELGHAVRQRWGEGKKAWSYRAQQLGCREGL